MRLTRQDIAPSALVEAFRAAKGQPPVRAALYEQFGGARFRANASVRQFRASFQRGIMAQLVE
jgi:hypothetical protein